MKHLDGKIALITGAAQGQGAAAARLLHEEGAFVYLADVKNGRPVASELGDDAAEFLDLDVTDETAWAAAARRVEERHGRLDVLVNNAGITGRLSPFLELKAEDFRTTFEVNIIGQFLGMKAFVPLMPEGSSIVNIASVNGIRGNPKLAHYAASKFAARGLSRTAAIELAPLGIRVNAVLPGAIDSPMTEPGDRGYDPRPMLAERSPFKRIGRVDEVAGIIAFLASDAASFCSGGDYIVDGGWCA
jgi:3alpha(or 20beta)-hydroxysteroid dehydrogenase